MNRDELLKLPDDQIDALVAEKVMGWKSCDRERCGWGKGPPVWLTGKEESPTFQGFEPSTDVSHAWAVVEKMRTTEQICVTLSSGTGQKEWLVIISGNLEAAVHAPTMPRAVAVAALLASGSDGKEGA